MTERRKNEDAEGDLWFRCISCGFDWEAPKTHPEPARCPECDRQGMPMEIGEDE